MSERGFHPTEDNYIEVIVELVFQESMLGASTFLSILPLEESLQLLSSEEL